MISRLKRQLYIQLDTQAWPYRGLSPFNKVIITVIALAVIAVTLETEESIERKFKRAFTIIDLGVGTFFSIEYLLRLWVIGERQEYSGLAGRLRYIVSPAALIDLAAILPFALGWLASDVFLLRLVRLFRIFSLARFGRYSRAMSHLRDAVMERKHELVLSILFSSAVLYVASAAEYFLEGPTQPEVFGSIPRAMWWGVITLTTVGYGDVIPQTPLGKLCGALTALAAVGVIAMPAGIMAAAFSDAFRRHKEAQFEEDDHMGSTDRKLSME